MILTMEMYEEIRAYHNQGRSIRWIAKRMRISRQTVKKYCRGETIPGVRKEYHREMLLMGDNQYARPSTSLVK